ncbi:RIB43A-like with coiled-coils protein 2 [Polymixia lowei]
MQVKEKKKKAEAEKESLNAYAADMVRNDKAAHLLDSRQVKEQRAMEKAIVNYRQNFQQPRYQRECDLNDPAHCKIADRDGAQMMLPGLAGEDPDSSARLKRQKEQFREWSVQQQRERTAARLQQKLEDEQYDQWRVSLDNKALQLQKIEEERRKAAALATKDYNLAKAAELKERHRRELEHSEEDNRTEILNHLQAELIDNGAGPNCAVPGMPRLPPSLSQRVSFQDMQYILQFHKYQLEEKKRTELERNQEEEQQDRFRLDSARTALLLERRQARINRQLRRDLDRSNAKLAEAQKQQKKALEKEYVNIPDDSYFSQFNTSSR